MSHKEGREQESSKKEIEIWHQEKRKQVRKERHKGTMLETRNKGRMQKTKLEHKEAGKLKTTRKKEKT